MSEDWRYAFNSVVGASHLRRNLPCQDASAVRVVTAKTGERILLAIVSDGAGSSLRAEQAAQLACESFLEKSGRLFAEGGELRDATREFFLAWVARFQTEATVLAEAEGLGIYEYGCTAAAAIIGENEAAFFQVGDGAIVVNGERESDDRSGWKYDWVFWPLKGEFANETSFLIGVGTLFAAEYDFVTHRVTELALFTDGLERLLLNLSEQTVHSPFFQKAFAPLCALPPGHGESLSQSLAEFLASGEVNERTDDDKTLILATRDARQ